MAMEFWGVEVKPGETTKFLSGDLEEEKYLHISQVSLGETKKDKAGESVPVFVNVNGQKLVIGTLSAEKCPQFLVDLVFEKEFELSHGSKNTSVCFLGYMSGKDDFSDSELSGDLSESDAEDEIQVGKQANGNEAKEGTKPTAGKANAVKLDASSSKSKAKIDEPKKSNKPEGDDEDDEDDDDDSVGDESEDESDDDEAMVDSEDESDDEDDSDEDEATPKKIESGKKRPAESASKTPVPEKKAKLVTPPGGQKTGGDGKKGGHTATPHPAKQTAKTPGSANKGKQQSPKSAGSVTCKSCSKSFGSENALQAHAKAKHGTN